MKKHILSALLLSLCTGSVLAQNYYENAEPPQDEAAEALRRTRFGVFVAPSVSWMKPTTEKDGNLKQKSDGSKIGFIYGIMGDYNFTDNYAIATGLQINSTGGKISTSNQTPAPPAGTVLQSSFNYAIQYLEIPVTLKLRTDEINRFRFFGQAGITLGFNISKKATWDITQATASGDTVIKTDTKEKITGKVGSIAPVVFQMTLGAGAEYRMNRKLDGYIGLFFNNGFAPDITRPDNFSKTPGFKDGNVRLNNFSLRLGFYF